MAHVMRTHEAIVHSIYETADPSGRRKRKRTTLPEPAEEHAEVTAFRLKLDSVQLKSWPLTLHSASFIRPPKHSDHNTLIHTKHFGVGTSSSNAHEALLFVTIFNKLSWGHRLLSRSSQHVLLSSQTLGDLFEIIPCISNEIPKESVDDTGETPTYELSPSADRRRPEGSTGCAACIEGTVYGDGQSVEDYSEKLIKLLSALPGDKDKRSPLTKGSAMHDTTFSSLSLRLHEPYWLLHHGNCEHFFVVDQIRLHHPGDPALPAYPLTTQITPPLLDLCRACNKVPAVHAIVGDIRLGESPFVICGPCWRWMGIPKGPDGECVRVVPLPKHEHGWGG
ncbi:hypothetical protein AcW1_009012 [Taiwanofungus camphoratus]|nr:hypothetical protein AcW1_009012 [Antrodia cinnamomea]